jgi:hypothetical protein
MGNRRRARRFSVLSSLVLAAVLLGVSALPVSAAPATHLNQVGSGGYYVYATIVHDGTNDDCYAFPNAYYRVKFKAHVKSVTTTQFVVDDVWVTYEVVRGTTWTNLFYIAGSYDRWPTTGTKFQGDYVHGGQSRTYFYDVNKTFRKDATVSNRSSYYEPGVCDNFDYWILYIY